MVLPNNSDAPELGHQLSVTGSTWALPRQGMETIGVAQ
jgi:hypothetical protein